MTSAQPMGISQQLITRRPVWRPSTGPRQTLRAAVALLCGRGMLSLCDQAVVSGTSFVTSVVIGRLLNQASLGVFFLGWNLVLLARAVQGDLITSPYMIYNRRCAAERRPEYTGSVVCHEMVFVIFSVAVLAGICLPASALGNGTPIGTRVAILAAIPLLLLREFVRNLSFAHLDLKSLLIADSAIAVLQLGMLGVLAYTGRLGVGTAYLAIAVACAVISSLWWIVRGPTCRFSIHAAWSDWIDNWQFGRWACAGQLSSRAAAYLLPWIVAWLHGPAATGVLAACTTLVNMAGMFVTGISNYLTPRAAEAYARQAAAGLVQVLRRFALLYLGTVGGFALLMALFGGPLAGLVFGPEYLGHGTVVFLLAVNLLLNSLGITAGNGLWALDRPRANFVADLAALVSGIAMLLILVRPYGVAGAAAALVCGTSVGTALRVWSLRQQLATLPLCDREELQHS